MEYNYRLFKRTAHFFFPYLINNPDSRKKCGIAVGLILLDILAASLVPYFSKNIVDTLNLNIMNSVLILVFLLALFWTIEKISNHIQEILFFPVVNNSIREITSNVVQHVHQISLIEYQKLSIPEIISCIKRISLSARSFFKISILMIFPTFIKLIIATAVALKIGIFGIILIPAFCLCLFTLYRGTKEYVKARDKAWDITDLVTMRVSDSIINSKMVRPFFDFEMKQVNTLLGQEAKLWYSTNNRLHLIYVLVGLILGCTLFFFLSFTVHGIQNHHLSIGDLILIKGQLIAAFLPLKNLTLEFRQLAESTIDINKIINILDIPKDKRYDDVDVKDSPQNIENVFLNHSKIYLACKNVHFNYETAQPIFQNLSFEIGFSEKLVIIGDNGSGKSTLVSLLSGLLKPSAGVVFINEWDIQCYPPTLLNKLIHYIPQDVRLFNLSLKENICYGLDKVSDEMLYDVLTQMELMPLVKDLPKGIDSPVGEMGIRLSGGEKQRVALARALLLNPKILILDETLHSLTAKGERDVLQQFTQSTVIIVSHHLNSIPQNYRVYKLERGCLYELNKEEIDKIVGFCHPNEVKDTPQAPIKLNKPEMIYENNET